MKYAAAILFGAFLFSCGDSEKERGLQTKAKREQQMKEYESAFKVAVMPTIDCLPIYLLKDSMLYDTTKVDIRLRRYKAQMDCDTALVGGSVQGSATDLVRSERLKSKGLSLEYVAATNAHWKLIANKRARLKELSQFSDKMIAMTRYSATDLLTDKAMMHAKTKYPAYKIQINDVELRLRMLIGNEMDAAWLPEPQATEARIAGHNLLMDSQKDSLSLGVVAFRKTDLSEKRRRQELDEFVRAYDRACQLINQHGIGYYSALIQKYMNADRQVVEALPKMTFDRAFSPKPKNIAQAQAFLH
ncbi:MAG: ABC transporter substrate-binding protein [Prevotella sp.]|nr:ABC transporter substrate-binding protein [Prevotella sp.]